jgi:putative nucleotidyltransferase with HDIG domain
MSAVMTANTPIDAAVLTRRIGQLPTLPQAVLDVMALLRNEDSSAEQCAAAIARDGGMTAVVLRLANSAFYGVPGRVASVRDALHLLGRRTLAGVLTTAAVCTRLERPACEGFDFVAFWRHGLATAIAAQSLARDLALDDDVAFTAGLLHDVGIAVLASQWPEALAAAIAAANEADRPLAELERALLGADHASIGAALAVHWHFPAPVVEAIAHHHAPAGAPGIADLVHVADAVAHALDLDAGEHERVPALADGAWGRLAPKPAQVLRAFERTETGVAALCQALGV